MEAAEAAAENPNNQTFADIFAEVSDATAVAEPEGEETYAPTEGEPDAEMDVGDDLEKDEHVEHGHVEGQNAEAGQAVLVTTSNFNVDSIITLSIFPKHGAYCLNSIR